MKKQSNHKQGAWGLVITIVVLLGLGVGSIQAQDLKINARPLTPQEIKDYGLTNTTQTAGGNHVVGLGQPVYLELLAKDGGAVTQVVWSLDAVIDLDDEPILNSTAVLTNSPLPMAMPTYDSVDRSAFDLLDRAMIVPDKKGTYQISAQALTTNGLLDTSFEVVGSVFIGKDNTACTLCHASKQTDYNLTHHAGAFTEQINGEGSSHFQSYCIKCHTTGYDNAPAAINDGFDDVALAEGWTFPTELSTNNWADMPLALQEKSNVQCESCHGPAQEHMRTGGDISKIAISLSAGNCGQCHDAATHHVKNFEWGSSVHGQTEVDRGGSCGNCHTTAGFIDANDPGMNEDGIEVPITATFKEGITCAACHDPHGPASGVHQIRAISSSTLSNGDVITDGGKGLICMSCHKSRRDGESYVLGNANKHFGPHHGPQTDMLAGKNAIEYGQELPSSKHLTAVDDACVQCHMQKTPGDIPAFAKNKVGGHSFGLFFDDGINPVVHLTETCTSCHGDIEDFDFGGEDYNRDGLIEGVQTEIHHLLDDLGMLLPPIGSPSVDMYNLYAQFNTQSLKSGAYNYLFVEEDGSHGVHNPKYAAALLRSSIEDLSGGIDIDNDGLVDSWEIENFGDLTSESGDGDYDGDGLSNRAEARLGTNAKLSDSDGDGFSDKVELQGNSDPLNIDSVPSSDLIMLPAAEIGYMPKGTGTTVNIQMASDLSDGVWTNVGEAQQSTGNWIYQLDSMQGTTNRFYRATEE